MVRGLVWLGLAASVCGCVRPVENQGGTATEAGPGPIDGSLVVYSALDREFAEPVLKDLARQAGLSVRSKFDVESTKTVGLTNTLIAEAVQPRCDLFWNNEILNTIRLKERGLLQPYRPRHADDVPGAFKDPDGNWYGFAARARILVVNTRSVPDADRPKGLADLVNPAGRVRSASPSRSLERLPPKLLASSRSGAMRKRRLSSVNSRPMGSRFFQATSRSPRQRAQGRLPSA